MWTHVVRTSRLTTVFSPSPTPARSAFSLISWIPFASRGKERLAHPVTSPLSLDLTILTVGIGEVSSEPQEYDPGLVDVVRRLSMASRAFGFVGILLFREKGEVDFDGGYYLNDFVLPVCNSTKYLDLTRSSTMRDSIQWISDNIWHSLNIMATFVNPYMQKILPTLMTDIHMNQKSMPSS